jgi:hypothetical protein
MQEGKDSAVWLAAAARLIDSEDIIAQRVMRAVKREPNWTRDQFDACVQAEIDLVDWTKAGLGTRAFGIAKAEKLNGKLVSKVAKGQATMADVLQAVELQQKGHLAELEEHFRMLLPEEFETKTK